ncbi:MAG: lactonase family protein [Verrucomicrobia bacterium]|nr:lactonase family protein [Cytophagales bacterium]
MNKFLYFISFLISLNALSQEKNYLLVGTYTSGKSEGIYVYEFDTKTGDFKLGSTAKTSNPSYLTVSPDQKFVYAVGENGNNGGSLVSFAFDKQTGTLTELNRRSSGGKSPCYVTIDKTGKWIFTGNYSSGTVALLPVNEKGMVDSASIVFQHEGSSVNKQRQESPHVHATVLSPDDQYLFVPDLGIDKVMIYKFDAQAGKLAPATIPFAKTQPGVGPRHFEIHPNGKFAYLIEELSGRVTFFKVKDGVLTPIQSISALPLDFKGVIGSADIHLSPDGRFLYASNRGESNTIAIFKTDLKNGKLTPVGHQSVLGKTPRNFNFDPTGKFLLVANQNSDEIVIFSRNLQTGLLTDTKKRITVPNPVCIKWVDSK